MCFLIPQAKTHPSFFIFTYPENISIKHESDMEHSSDEKEFTREGGEEKVRINNDRARRERVTRPLSGKHKNKAGVAGEM